VDKVDGVDKIGWSPTNKPPVDGSEKGEIEPEWEEKALSGRKTLLCQETKFLFNLSSSAGKKAPKPDVTRQAGNSNADGKLDTNYEEYGVPSLK
jgi:hypothetical protein